MKNTITALLVLTLSAVSFLVSANEQELSGSSLKDAVTPAPGANYENKDGIYRGIIEQNNAGFALTNGTGTYQIKQAREPGIPPLETMVGKVVMVSGHIVKSKHGFFLKVTNAVTAE